MTAALTLGDCLHRGLTPGACPHRSGSFCADCVNTGEPCPDHRQDPAADAEAAS